MADRNPTNHDHLPIGVLIPERCIAANLSAVGSGSTDSTYTEAIPRPGLPIPDDSHSRLRLEVSNAQGEDIVATCLGAGNPGRRSAKLALQGETGFRIAWNRPGLHFGWKPVDWDNASARTDIATIPSTQKAIIAYRDSANTEAGLAVVGTDHTVTIAAGTMDDGTDWNFPAVVVLPGSERVLIAYGGTIFFTDDLGASVGTYSPDPIPGLSSTNWEDTVMAEYRGDIIMLVSDNTVDTLQHLVSTDLGATFELVREYTSFGGMPSVVANEDGIHVSYLLRTGTEKVFYRTLGTPFEELDAVTATEIATGGDFNSSTIISDGGGTLFLAHTDGARVDLSDSTDSGETWNESPRIGGQPLRINNNSDRYARLRSTWALGQLYLMHGYNDNGTEATTRCAMAVLAGWSDLSVYNTPGRDGFRGFGDGAVFSFTYHPFTIPSGQGWNQTGAGTETLHSTGALSMSTVANTLFYDSGAIAGAAALLHGNTSWLVISGGSTTTQDMAILLRLADAATYEFEAEVLIKDDTITLNDLNSAATDSISIDMTADYVRISFFMTKGGLTISVGTEGVTNETDDASVNLTDAGATANQSLATWGHIASATAESRVRYFNMHNQATGFTEIFATLAVNGKAFNSRPEAVPDFGDGTYAMFLAAAAGPARFGETIDIDAFYENAIENAHIEVHRKPSKRWRSTSTAEQVIAYDLGSTSWAGNGIGLYVEDANFRKALVESFNGATWDTEMTLDLADGFTSLTWSVDGDIITPNTSTTADADRWLWEQELAPGGWVEPSAGGVNATRIVAQSSGGWTQQTTVIPSIRVEDASLIVGTTGGALVWPTGLVVKHFTTVATSHARFWRVRIPAGTAGDDTPDGESFYEAGAISLCRLQLLGGHSEWGKADTGTRNARDSEDSAGTIRTQERGELRRRWTLGWPNGEHWVQIRANGPDVHFWGASSRLGNVGAEDISEMVRGLIQLTSSGQVPLIALDPTPETDGTIITDRTLFLYGALTTGVSTTMASGLEGESEDRRIETISITEIVG